jgi:prevent-host-death family protein
MRSIGVRELKAHTSQILRLVQDQGEEITVTHRGRVIARLIPAEVPQTTYDDAAVWANLDQLAAEIGAHWPAGVTAAESVAEGRREL